MAKGQKMKKILFIAAALIAVLSITLVLAFVIQNLTTPLNVAHGTSGSGSFEINNTSGENIIGITCTALGTSGAWITYTSCPTTLANGDVTTVTFDVTVPQYQAPSSYSISLRIDGTGETSATPFFDTESLLVVVDSDPSLDMDSSLTIEGYMGDSETDNFTLTNDGNVDFGVINFDYDQADLTDDDANEITLTFSPDPASLNAGASDDIDVTASVDSDMKYGTYSTQITATSGTTTDSMDFTFRVKKKFCDSGAQGDRLVITNIEEPDSGDDFILPATIPVEVDVKNDYDEDLDAVLEARLFDVTDDVYVADEMSDEVSINDGDTETLKVELEIPIDIENGHSFIVIIKVYEDGNENDQCEDDYVTVNINKDKNKVILDKTIITPETVECDGDFSAQLKFANVGREDEDKVKVRIYNVNLGIDEEKTFSVDENEYETVNFNALHIPEDAEEGDYTLNIAWDYNYDDNDDEYDSSGDGEATINVEGNCKVPVYDVLISTQQLSTAKPEEEVTIKVTLTNTGNEKTTYTIGATGYSEWATLESIDPKTLTLEAGNSGYVNIKLTPEETGTKEFKVTVDFQGKVETKDVTVKVMATSEAASWFEQTWFSIKHNWEWVLVNAVLAIAIIVLFVLLLTKGHKSKHPVYVVKGNKNSKGPTEISLARNTAARKTTRKARRKKR